MILHGQISQRTGTSSIDFVQDVICTHVPLHQMPRIILTINVSLRLRGRPSKDPGQSIWRMIWIVQYWQDQVKRALAEILQNA